MKISDPRSYPRRAAQRTAPSRKKAAASAQADSTRWMLWQLMASVVLFLVVYIGRGVSPDSQEIWRAALEQDVDFSGVFQAVSEGETPARILDNLYQQLVHPGVDAAESPEGTGLPDTRALTFQDAVQRSTARRMGISSLQQTLISGLPSPGESLAPVPPASPSPADEETPMPTDSQPPVSATQEPAETPAPTPEPTSTPEPTPVPTEQVVTAMAQEYNEAGEKLPSNVSMQYYPLGLAKTVNPVEGPISSTFGYRISPITNRKEFHLALDIAVPDGTPVKAFADGVVEYIGKSDDFGLYLSILHDNNVSSFYAHCSELLVHQGMTVSCGEVVAYSGHTGNVTGPHLHLLITKDHIRLNPIHYVDL